jgi:hypothetical protein
MPRAPLLSCLQSLAVFAMLATTLIGVGRLAVAAEPPTAPPDTRLITRLTPSQAKRVVERHKDLVLNLNALESLDADVARALGGSKSQWLFLDGLKTIDAETARAFAGYKGHLGLSGLELLDVDTARALAEVERAGLFFDGLPTIDTDVAEELSRFKGGLLRLDGLTTLDAATASAIARSRARSLALNRLRTVDAETTQSLLQFEGVFHFTALHETVGRETPLTVEVVRLVCLAANKAPYAVSLPGVTAIDSRDSVGIAQALAQRQAPLALPNLEKISPKTLAALLQKQDVEIPLIETLELIPEPDGGATDDFVIPEGFQERQKR